MRVQQGNLGDYHSVGNGVFEFRFHFGAGPRVYFGFDGDELILLLCGGITALSKKIGTKMGKLPNINTWHIQMIYA